MTRARLSRQQGAEQAQERIEAAQRVLADEVEAVQSGDDWKRYLEFQARLPSYGPRNVIL